MYDTLHISILYMFTWLNYWLYNKHQQIKCINISWIPSLIYSLYFIHACMHPSIPPYLHTSIPTYLPTYIRTYIHTYMYIAIYIYLDMKPDASEYRRFWSRLAQRYIVLISTTRNLDNENTTIRTYDEYIMTGQRREYSLSHIGIKFESLHHLRTRYILIPLDFGFILSGIYR
jgi:hypothetical protein